jgi:SAM-dependent methyltransferase
VRQFDRHADAYDAIRGKITYPEALYDRLASACPSREAALDLGCGNGASTVGLAARFARVVGIDPGERLLEKARAHLPEVTFVRGAAESATVPGTFDLIACGTAFYWMDRGAVLARCAEWLAKGGVFCAYRYEFPVVYGPARDLVEAELSARWARHRDPRLVAYDDTRERLEATGRFTGAERFVVPNVLTLSPAELGLFFLSTSYGTRYREAEGGPKYPEDLLARLRAVEPGPTVRVNFEIHAFVACKAS